MLLVSVIFFFTVTDIVEYTDCDIHG